MKRTGNIRTSLKRRRRRDDRMSDYDRLPAELRRWLSTSILPWRPKSVQRTYDNVLARTGDASLALEELSRIERRQIAKDARKVWGETHPSTTSYHLG